MDEGTDLVVYARDNGVCYNFRFKQFSQSSGTCVFQNEWIRFVREKALEAGTIVKCWWDKENRRFSVSCHSPGMIFRQLHSRSTSSLYFLLKFFLWVDCWCTIPSNELPVTEINVCLFSLTGWPQVIRSVPASGWGISVGVHVRNKMSIVSTCQSYLITTCLVWFIWLETHIRRVSSCIHLIILNVFLLLSSYQLCNGILIKLS